MSVAVTRREALANRQGPAPPSPMLDLLVSCSGLWLAAGCLAGSSTLVETFGTPYGAIFWGGLFAAAALVAAYAWRNARLHYTGIDTLPAAYHPALLGIPIAAAGFAADLLLQRIFGGRRSFEPLVNPAHLVIGIGILLVLSGPVRSALQRRAGLSTLRAQLPLLFALAAWLEFIHIGVAFGFDPGAARLYVPPGANGYGTGYFADTAVGLYKSGSGLMIVLLQATLLTGIAVWTIARFALRPGALGILFVLGNCGMAAVATDDTPMLATYVAMSVAAGLAGDFIVARLHPSPANPLTFGLFGACIPGVYFATYFIVTALTGGVWWSFTLALGAVVWSIICGLAISFFAGRPRVAG